MTERGMERERHTMKRKCIFFTYNYRYYSPELGRWLSRDPSQELNSINLYLFCQNNCIEKYDHLEDYGSVNWVEKVSCQETIVYNRGAAKRVVLVDCGVKANIIRCLIHRGIEVVRVPWDYDFNQLEFDGLFLANGPGDPEHTHVSSEQTSSPLHGHLPGQSAPGTRSRCQDLQAEVWSPLAQPARAAGGHQPLLHHLAKPWLRRRRQDIACRLGTAVRQYERRIERGHPPQDESLVLGTIPSGSLLGTGRHRVDVRRICKLSGKSGQGRELLPALCGKYFYT